MKKWYTLNNIGKFYASTTSNKVPKVFRYSAILKEDVDEELLQNALNKTIDVYRNFNVNLKRGFFWYYLDETSKVNKVTKENLPVCFKLYNNSDDYLYRVSYYKKKINFEISHILSDGRGSVDFFKLLVSNYINIKYELNIDTYKENKSVLEKTEDSFSKYYKKPKLSMKERIKPYRYKGKKLRNQTLFMESHMDVKEVLKIAHSNNTTLTGLLVSVLIYSFKDVMNVSDMHKPITIDIPVDLRNYFKSSSSNNFFGMTSVTYKIKSKDDTLEEIIEEVSKQFKNNLTKEKLAERANLMVLFEKNWFCKFVPISIKNLVINMFKNMYSQNSTTSLSNVGIIKFDKEIEDKIDNVCVLTSTNDFQFTICSLKKDLSIGVSSNYLHNDVIMNFFRYFTANDIKIMMNVSEVEQ